MTTELSGVQVTRSPAQFMAEEDGLGVGGGLSRDSADGSPFRSGERAGLEIELSRNNAGGRSSSISNINRRNSGAMWSLFGPSLRLLLHTPFNRSEANQATSSAVVQHGVVIPTEAVRTLGAIAKVHLGSGMMRVRAGESVTTGEASGAQTWADWPGGLLEGLSAGDGDGRPAQAPNFAPQKRWYFVGGGNVEDCEEHRDIKLGLVDEIDWAANAVVVFREGLAMPTNTLLRVVNTAHAVLVLRNGGQYYYLHNGFVLSTDEEESLREWGVGRALFANICLAVGGTMLVAFAGQIWQPLIVGTLLVAAAGYRIEGALTNLLRVTSNEWEQHGLVPSGIYGIERVIQVVLVTLVALGDLLENRELLLWSLICAALNVVLMETACQVVVTWGFRRYTNVLLEQFRDWMLLAVGGVACLWLLYVFGGAFFALAWGQAGRATLFAIVSCPSGKVALACDTVIFFGVWAVVFSAGVVDWEEADLKTSLQSLQPWAWSLTRAPDSFFTGLRLLGLWATAVGYFIAIVRLTPLLFTFRISSDRTAESEWLGVRGERTRARGTKGKFSEYHALSIPSRNTFS